MSIGSIIREAAKAAHAATNDGDIGKTFTLTAPGGVSDPTTNTFTPGGTPVTFDGWEGHYDRSKIDGVNIMSNDRQIMIIISDTAVADYPDTKFTITLEGKEYGIIDADPDTAGAVMTLQARR